MTPSPRRIILLGSLLASLAAAFADPLPLPNARLPDAAPLPPMVVTPGGQRLLLDYTDATLTLDPATGALAGNKPGWWFINYPPDRIAGLDPAGLPSLLTRLGGRSGEVKNWYWKQKYDPAVSAPAPEPARPDGPVPVRLSRAPDYVVNPTHPHSGDNGPGTAERPFKTLAAALRVARPGVTLHVHPGVYREKIDLAANGTANAPIRVEGIRGSHGEWPVISGNLPFPPDAWSPVPGIDGVWRAPLFTRLEGMLSADLAEGNVTLVERGRPQDLLPGEYAFNRGSDEALRPLFDPAAPLAAQNTQGRSWHHLATDEDGMLDLEKAFGASAHNAVIWISARVWLDPSSRPQGEVWDPRNPEPVTGRVSFGGPFRAARQTGSGPGSQSHALTLYLNGDYIEPVTHRLNPPPEGAVQASANRNYGISDRWNSLPFREGWNTLLLQLDTTASTRKPLRFRLGLPE
ncbi:MAG: DUF1565 domain-containing protein, partial [Opitutaceae bacterium]|nr:DUF1565 domain-containing protein [Opitutaceae bacterium]